MQHLLKNTSFVFISRKQLFSVGAFSNKKYPTLTVAGFVRQTIDLILNVRFLQTSHLSSKGLSRSLRMLEGTPVEFLSVFIVSSWDQTVPVSCFPALCDFLKSLIFRPSIISCFQLGQYVSRAQRFPLRVFGH